MLPNRREMLRWGTLGGLAHVLGSNSVSAFLAPSGSEARSLKITGVKVTPVALPDPPLLFSGGCHGPYFLRNIVEITTGDGIVGLGETVGGEGMTNALERAREHVVGRSAFAYRGFARELMKLGPGCYAGLELACLDACGKATGRRLCELLGGPVRDPVEFAAYLFFRYAADNPIVLADPHVVDARGTGSKALDAWGEVRTPAAMAELARSFERKWGFKVFKLKGGVLTPDIERESLAAMSATLAPGALLRIDPNGRWTTATAIRIGKALKALSMEYYEDPVSGQAAMAEVRRQTGLKMSTNMCVTRFDHLEEAFRVKPIDVLLADHHYFGGFAGCLALGPVCDTVGWRMSQHSNNHSGVTMAAMIHLGAAIPQLTCASDTHYPWLPDDSDLIEGPKLAIKNGTMAVPSGPGLGVGLDRDKLARANEISKRCGMKGRDDRPLMRRLDPGWTGESQ